MAEAERERMPKTHLMQNATGTRRWPSLILFLFLLLFISANETRPKSISPLEPVDHKQWRRNDYSWYVDPNKKSEGFPYREDVGGNIGYLPQKPFHILRLFDTSAEMKTNLNLSAIFETKSARILDLQCL